MVRDGQIFKDDWIETYMKVRLTNWTRNGESVKVFFFNVKFEDVMEFVNNQRVPFAPMFPASCLCCSMYRTSS